MRRRGRWILASVLVVLVGGLLAWHPWKRVSLDDASFVFAGKAGVTPPPAWADVMVVVYSGDGGWSDLDEGLGKAMVDLGVPVLGISSFKYFWRPRPAEIAGPELDAAVAKYQAIWHKRRVLLIGFSFGADVVPSILANVTPATRASIAQIVLLSPSRDVNFEIEMEDYMVANWFTTKMRVFTQWLNPIPHYPAIPPLAALNGAPPVACYYGKEQQDESLCTDAGLPRWVVVHPMPGTHHFDANYPALAERLIKDFPH
jgi:type IV secretory pathway VirJ component